MPCQSTRSKANHLIGPTHHVPLPVQWASIWCPSRSQWLMYTQTWGLRGSYTPPQPTPLLHPKVRSSCMYMHRYMYCRDIRAHTPEWGQGISTHNLKWGHRIGTCILEWGQGIGTCILEWGQGIGTQIVAIPGRNWTLFHCIFWLHNSIEIHNRTMFDFYPGLPQLYY